MVASIEGGEGADVCVEGVRFVDVEGGGVDFVHAEAGVEVGEGCDAGANPARGEGGVAGLDGAVVGIVDHLLVFVGVTEKDVGDDVGGVAVDDLVEEVCGIWEGVPVEC